MLNSQPAETHGKKINEFLKIKLKIKANKNDRSNNKIKNTT